MTVAKLRGARERIRRQQGKCEGRKTRLERTKERPEASKAFLEAIAMAKRLHRASPKTGKRRSLREISDEVAAAGLFNEQGRQYHPESVRRMIEGIGHLTKKRREPD